MDFFELSCPVAYVLRAVSDFTQGDLFLLYLYWCLIPEHKHSIPMIVAVLFYQFLLIVLVFLPVLDCHSNLSS